MSSSADVAFDVQMDGTKLFWKVQSNPEGSSQAVKDHVDNLTKSLNTDYPSTYQLTWGSNVGNRVSYETMVARLGGNVCRKNAHVLGSSVHIFPTNASGVPNWEAEKPLTYRSNFEKCLKTENDPATGHKRTFFLDTEGQPELRP